MATLMSAYPRFEAVQTPRVLRFLVFSILLIFGFYTHAETLYFNQLKSKDGLADDKVQAIVRGQESYVWIGTYSGLSRFDGKRIVNYKYAINDERSIPSNNITTLFLSSDSVLWLGTHDGGLAYYDHIHDSFISFNTLNSALPSNTVTAIDEGHDGVLWVGTADGLCFWDPQEKKLKSADFISGSSRVRINTSVTAIDCAPDNTIWIGTANGVFQYNSVQYKLSSVTGAFEDCHVLDLKCSDGNVWLGTKENGLLCYKSGQAELANYFVDSDDCSQVNDLAFDKEGNLWFAIDLKGIYKLGLDDGGIDFFCQNKQDENSLGSERPSTIYIDESGVVWVGHTRKGLSYSVLSKSAQIVRQKSLENDHFFEFVQALTFKNDKLVAIGTDGYGVSICEYDRYENQMSEIKNYLAGMSVLSLCFSPSKDTLWAGTYRNGLILIDLKSGKTQQFSHVHKKTESIAGNDVRSIAYNNDKTKLLLAIHGAGMSVYNLKTKRFTNHIAEKEDVARIKNPWVYEVMTDKSGVVWAASAYGLSRMNEPLPIFKTYLYKPDQPENVSRCHFVDIYEDRQGRFWAATENGICLFNRNAEIFEFFAPRMVDDVKVGILSIEEDGDGNLWLPSTEGLLLFDTKQKKFKRALQSDIVGAKDFFRRSSAQNSEGTILLGCSKGILAVKPSNVFAESGQYSLSVNIDEFRVHNKLVKSYVDSAMLHMHIKYMDSIALLSHQNSISIYYSAVDFFAPSLHQYRYRLVGFDKNWNYVGQDNRAVYTELHPGSYTFEVEVSRDGEKWVSREKPLHITVLTAWWMTWWFKASAAVTVLLMFVAVYRLRINSIKANEKKMAALVTQRTKELENTLRTIEENNIWIKAQNRTLSFQKEEIEAQKEAIKKKNDELLEVNQTKDKFLSIIAHDLKNPLHAVLGFSELLLNRERTVDEERKRLYFEQIHTSTSHLLAILDNLLQWARSQTSHLAVQPVQLFADLVVYDNLDQLKDFASRKDIRLQSEVHKSIEFYADKNMVNTILRNLISNAIKYSYKGGAVTVSSDNDSNGGVLFCVKDNGTGMSEEKASKLFALGKKQSAPGTHNEVGTGLGLIICKEFIEKHNGKIWLESEEGVGSSFFFSIPSVTALNLSVESLAKQN